MLKLASALNSADAPRATPPIHADPRKAGGFQVPSMTVCVLCQCMPVQDRARRRDGFRIMKKRSRPMASNEPLSQGRYANHAIAIVASDTIAERASAAIVVPARITSPRSGMISATMANGANPRAIPIKQQKNPHPRSTHAMIRFFWFARSIIDAASSSPNSISSTADLERALNGSNEPRACRATILTSVG